MTDMLQKKKSSGAPESRAADASLHRPAWRRGGVRDSTLIGCDAGASPVIGRASKLLLALAESMTLLWGRDFADD